MRSYSRLASISAAGSEVTMKRGLASPSVHSALPMTRRMRLQLSKVDQLSWSPKTEQVGKRESSLGTAVWPEVRLVDYTEEAQCGVQGESGAGSDPGGWHG